MEVPSKMITDFDNHRRFHPVSYKLKNTVRTPKGLSIIKKDEKQLLNECERTINNTIIFVGFKGINI